MLAGGAELELGCQGGRERPQPPPRPSIHPAQPAALERPASAATGLHSQSGRLTPVQPRGRGQLEIPHPRASLKSKA
jgi:hypothetical protein